ncbi:hypothetical protein HS088_TW01G00649 [Tripterygium wilfordii]|uniref:Uncharacterized protein n=2 Tax=Tripterygium wilfordii TaxID=458696 RepID=A0A7J7E241_TRIWF|nr:hypothetical protein HS088_TW01G00649 [Tripterygium wilfordii]
MTKMPQDPKQDYYYPIKTQKGIRFIIGFLLPIFVYVSISYTFKLSPSNLFNNTKFWFFISNTLLLIIAADYNSFSENKKDDVYEEYVRRRTSHCQPRSNIISPSLVPSYSTTISKEDVEEVAEIKEVIITSENTQLGVEEKNKIEGERSYRRSKSERVKRVSFDESKNVIVRSSSAEKLDELPSKEEEVVEEEEGNEFSNMSNEELNRRCEDFIQRQIRLQRGQNFEI